MKTDDYRQNIENSRHKFLDDLCGGVVREEKQSRQNETIKKKQFRKISFKVRKASSIYRKNPVSNIQKTTITTTTVSELTSKFNEIIEKNNAPKEELKIRKFVERLNSFNSSVNKKTMKNTNQNSTNEQRMKELRKPSIKKKPILDEKIKIQTVKKQSSFRTPPKRNENMDNGETEGKMEEDGKLTNTGFVKAAIKNFEEKNFKPFAPKRSMTELHRIGLKNISEIETNRRKSCEPYFMVSSTLKIYEDKTDVVDSTYNCETTNVQTPKSKPQSPNLTKVEKPYYAWRNSNTTKSLVTTENKTVSIPPMLTKPEFVEKQRDEKEIKESQESLTNSHDENSRKQSFSLSIIDIIDENFPTVEDKETKPDFKPNTSFLWNRNLSKPYEDIEPFDSCNISSKNREKILSLPLFKTLPKDFKDVSEKNKDYEDLDDNDGYEPFDLKTDYEDVTPKKETQEEEDQYEFINNTSENIYETLPCTRQDKPLPKTPEEKPEVYLETKKEESASNCYESIYNNESISTLLTEENNYESIYFQDKKEISEKDISGSIVSSEQKTNSLYGTSLRSWNDETIYNGSATSDISFSDKSEWVDVSENEYEGGSKIFIIKEAVKSKKNTTWSEQYRQHWNKTTKAEYAKGADSDSDHHYETLKNSENGESEVCYDSFASDTDSDDSFENLENEENNGNFPLPPAPNSNDVLTRLSRHVRRFTKNLSMTTNDLSKSLTRITRRKSKNDVNETIVENNYVNVREGVPATTPTSEMNCITNTEDENNEKNKNLNRKGFLNKIRRSIIMSAEQANEITSNIKGKSTFYLTPTINIDDEEGDKKMEDDSGISLSPIDRNPRNRLVRPQEPPPPAPIPSLNEDLKKLFKEKRSTSWYAEVNLCTNPDIKNQKDKRSKTFWYDEIGLYQNSTSTPSTSSAENSGTNTNVTIRSLSSPTMNNSNQQAGEKYYNLKNENNYYNESVTSQNSNGNKTDVSLNSLSGDDIQMRLQNEPLYQFYDAAVLEYACHNGISDMDSDNYEDVEKKSSTELIPPPRPSAMELVSSKRKSLAFTKTLWCQIPEVLQSSVLSTLSSHQKKLQEAKFEMVTSEASYLNSLNVLNDHFIKNLKITLTDSEFDMLFGKIEAVRRSSDSLILDLEKCWQDNILLHGVCDIIQKHAEEDFSVYIPYCENHTMLEQLMKKLRERIYFSDTLKQLEASPVCQCLSLYSFLMLPMQRITRWPLLLDAVLKRLEQHDPEYLTCQYLLATINKIVNRCNEAARSKEREREMLEIQSKMEFGKGVSSIDIAIPNRWLVRSGSVIHMLPKSEEIKLTFGKKFSKTTLHLFLFNDLLIVAKSKGDGFFTVLHYCSRNFTELSTSEQLLSLPGKDMTGKHLFFLTLLENQNRKTVEFLLSCSSESDKQRWIEALSPPKSEDPDEVLYECWDCPQVTVIHNYNAEQPDELNLSKGDVINVSRKMADGWYQGERIRDGETGWFPANYTIEIANPHLRARNLKQRYRLLTYSENYLKNKS